MTISSNVTTTTPNNSGMSALSAKLKTQPATNPIHPESTEIAADSLVKQPETPKPAAASNPVSNFLLFTLNQFSKSAPKNFESINPDHYEEVQSVVNNEYNLFSALPLARASCTYGRKIDYNWN